MINFSLSTSVKIILSYRYAFLIALVLLVLPQKAFTQGYLANHYLSNKYVLESWGIEDGLPVNSIYEIEKSKTGYLWFASHDGLIRFDGIEFKIYTAADYPELRGNRIQHIKEAADSTLFIQSEGLNITKFKDGKFTHLVNLDEKLVGSGNNMGFYKDENGDLWFGGDSGIHIYKDGALSKFKPDIINFPVHGIALATDKEVWFHSPINHAFYRFKDDKLSLIVSNETDEDYFSLEVDNDTLWLSTKETLFKFYNETLDTLYRTTDKQLSSIAKDPNSRLHIATELSGYYYYENGELIQQFETISRAPSMEKPFLLDKDKSFWIITENEIYRNNSLVYRANISIKDFIEDNEGNLWVGTSKNGLIRLKPNLFTTYSTNQGIPTSSVYPLFQSSDSSVWIGTFGEGLARLKNNSINSDYRVYFDKKEFYIQTFAEKKDGTLLLSALGYGMLQLKKDSKIIEPYPAHPNLKNMNIFSIFIDSKERIWVGSSPGYDGGLFLNEDPNWTNICEDYNVPYTKVRFMLEAPNGDIWFATQGDGLIRYDNSNFYTYNTENGLSSDFPRALLITPDDNGGNILWVGYEDKGLDRVELVEGAPNFKSITNYQTKNGLFDNSIHIILEDDNQRFWINTNRGIFWVSKTNLEEFHRGEITTLQTRGYTEEDGMLNREGNGGVQPAGFKGWDGSMWFPTQDGIVTFHPDSILNNTIEPPIVIQSITSNDLSFPVNSKSISLSKHQRDLEINYAALSFLSSKKNQYKYFLEGYDDEWHDVGTRRTAYYTNLPPGSFTFRVKGTNNEGIWSSTDASIDIFVAPFFYETQEFYLLLTALLILFITYFIWVRSNLFYKREEELKKEVANRTNELLKEKNKTELQAKKLKELDVAKSKFFANVSHELRTPLTLIIGPLERIINGDIPKDSKLEREQQKMMLRNSKRLLSLIDQLLEITKLESSSLKLHAEAVQINQYIEQISNYFYTLCEAKQISLTFTPNASPGIVYIDKDKMEKVLGNLITNAIKFTPIGGFISITTEEDSTSYRIQIKDTGIGIAQEFLPKIFDRFYQVEKGGHQQSEGFGIGMSIAKELIELHSGTLSVDSELNKGTVFTFTLRKGTDHLLPNEISLPQTAPDHKYLINANLSASYAVNKVQPIPKNLTEDTTTILVIDDIADMRYYIASILSDKYRIVEASSGKEGYQKINSSPPDLIIADIMMPEMDGVQLNKLLKDNKNTSAIPFIFLTAKDDRQSKISGLKDGADIYLTKPFDDEELRACVENLLSSRLRLRNQLLAELPKIEKKATDTPELEDPFLKDLYEVMEAEYSNPELTVNMVQQKLFMSRSSFYRTINEKTGLNTQQFINKFRLEKAKEMLLNNKGSISEIAYACGFNSLSYFSRAFKDKYGKTPSSYLKKDG